MAPKDLFKIHHKKTGLYSKGGTGVNLNGTGMGWGKDGKVWQGMGPLKNHLAQYLPKYDPYYDSVQFKKNIGGILEDWEIIKIKMVVDDIIPMTDLYNTLEVIKRTSK